jgi:hypothetical protein
MAASEGEPATWHEWLVVGPLILDATEYYWEILHHITSINALGRVVPL